MYLLQQQEKPQRQVAPSDIRRANLHELRTCATNRARGTESPNHGLKLKAA
jgi:hypothetical protein